jgi:hypothetical protein
MHPKVRYAELYIDNQRVGQVEVRRWEHSWGFGQFLPNDAFAAFAPLFGQWSLLMHADEDQLSLSEAASQELARVERAIDALHVKLYFPAAGEWHQVGQVTIDGELIDWKERWAQQPG